MKIEQQEFRKTGQTNHYYLYLDIGNKEVEVSLTSYWDENNLTIALEYNILEGGDNLTKKEKDKIDNYIDNIDLSEAE
jgi:hypothetical protein